MSKTIVCICTYNRNDLLSRLLDSLKRAQLPPGSGIIVVDNNPPNAKVAVQSAGLPVRYACEAKRGISHARNRAIQEAMNLGADFIAFIDDDDIPEPDWLVCLCDAQRHTSADIVCGALRSGITKAKKVGNIKHRLRVDYDLPGDERGTCNTLISTSFLHRFGQIPFDPAFGFTGHEDQDFYIRAKKSGATLASAPKSIINHLEEPNRLTLKGMLRRSFNGGYAEMNFALVHASRTEISHLYRAAWRRTLLSLRLLIPGYANRSRMRKAARGLGVIYRRAGGRFEYYRSSRTAKKRGVVRRIRKRLARRLARSIGYEIGRSRFKPPEIFQINPAAQINPLVPFLEVLIREKPSMFFVQIGANDGLRDDPLHDFIVEHDPHGVLLEPQAEIFDILKNTYAGTRNLAFENAAISERRETRQLYRIKPEYTFIHNGWEIPSLVASFDRDHAIKHYAMSQGISFEKARSHDPTTTEEINCITFDYLLNKYDPNNIDLLVIDAEGYDYEAIKLFGFKRYKPSVVYYEHSNISEKDRQACWSYLVSLDYKLLPLEYNTIAIL